jgi:hypothetical protein
MAVLALALCLFVTAPSAFGQSNCPQPPGTPSTSPIRTLIPVHFDAITGNITVGSTTYCGTGPGFHMLSLKRQPDLNHLDAPDMLWDWTYTDAASVNSALQTLNTSANGGPIVMVNAVGNYGIPLNAVGGKLGQFGGWPDLLLIDGAPPFIFVGNAGRKPQTALQRGGSTLNLDGYLAQDSSGNYTFIRTDFVRYDITTDGTIKIGGTAYDVAGSYKPVCAGDTSNSFHLVIVDRESLQLQANNTYCTAQSDYEIQRLNGDINTLTSNLSDESKLVFLASNGHPIPADWDFGTDGDGRIYPVGEQVATLGGYWETMVYLTPNDTYSLVGAAPPPAGTPQPRQRARESSSVYPADVNGKAPTGELHGVLERGRGNWYSPMNADPTGLANFDLYNILAEDRVDFPRYDSDDQLAAAYKYINDYFISQNLCNVGTVNCIRGAYGNLNVDLVGTYQGKLLVLKDQNNNDCTYSYNAGLPFCQVRAQLLTEITDVTNVLTFYGNVTGLWSSSGSVTLASQLSVYNDVKATLPAPPTAEAPNLAKPIVGLLLTLGSKIPEIGPVFGLADVFFNFATELTTDQQGNKQIDLTSTIGNLQQQAADQFISQSNTTGTLFQLILEDWGKLNTLGSTLVGDSNPASPWYWSTTTTSKMLTNMDFVVRQAAYESIMPAAYAIGSYYPTTTNSNGWYWGQHPLYTQPWGYIVNQVVSSPSIPLIRPFAPPNYPVYPPYTYPSDSSNPWTSSPLTATILADNQWLAISSVNSAWNGSPLNDPNGTYNPPDASLLAKLFTPVSQNGLGVYRPAFFEGWPLEFGLN